MSSRVSALASFSLCAALVPGPPAAAETIDPSNRGFQYGWAENIGWINAEPLGDGGPGASIRGSRVIGWLWSENVGWISLSCENTASCGTVDFRVSHEQGDLIGWAWSENVGWVSLSCESIGSCATVSYGVTVDSGTGDLGGWGWSENAGWVSFSCVNTGSCTTVDYVVRTDPAVLAELVFEDGFESGDTSNWSNAVP